MERRVGLVPIKCAARTHARHEDDRFLRVRCKDSRCPDVQVGKSRGCRTFHVFDTENYIPALGTYLNWPEYEPDDRQGQE